MKEYDVLENLLDLDAILPYTGEDGGNYSRLILDRKNEKELVIRNRTKTVLNKLAKYYAIDLYELKRKVGALIGRKNLCPLPFHPGLILMPIKTRIPIIKDEGSIGYINFRKIDNVDFSGRNKARIRFMDGEEVESDQSENSVFILKEQARMLSISFFNSYFKYLN